LLCPRILSAVSALLQDRPHLRERPELRVLVSTEVAAEGVDLQFSSLLINYDLPWNPARIEQRIGRIDRIGQEAEKILTVGDALNYIDAHSDQA